MPLILAIESDQRQAARIARLAPAHLDAEIVVVDSVHAALEVLHARTPDLVLTPLLLSAKEDGALTRRLRELDADGRELQTLVTPVLASGNPLPAAEEKPGGLLKRLRKPKRVAPASSGCEPAIFAEQVREYLTRMAADREDALRADAWSRPQQAASAPMLTELLPMPSADVSEALPAQPEPDGVEFAAPRHEEFVASPRDEFVAPALEEPVAGPPEPFVAPVREEFVSAPREDVVAPVHEEIAELPQEDVDAAPIRALDHQLTDDTADMADVPIAASAETLTEEDDELVAAEPTEPYRLEAAEPPDDSTVDSQPELDVRPVAETEETDPAVEPTWEDLESFLEELELEQAFANVHTVTAQEAEPAVIELPSADELWAPLAGAQQQTISPLEGPAMKKRRVAASKTPKSSRAQAGEARPDVPRKPRRPKASPKPMQDEWGLYDPEQCGFAALLERLKEMSDADAKPPERKGRSAIMRR
jgi:hypothetical protein